MSAFPVMKVDVLLLPPLSHPSIPKLFICQNVLVCGVYMYHRISKDILEILIIPKPSRYLFHCSSYIYERFCPVAITRYNNQSIIGKEVTALKAFLGEEVDPLIGTAYRFYLIFTK